MSYKDLHEEPFKDSTIAKLEIFEDYAEAWIPTFVMRKVPTICIFDFFAGTGYDKDGVAGSPIRLLGQIKKHVGYIFQNNVSVQLYLNEFEPHKEQRKIALLQKACEDYLEHNSDVKRAVKEIKYFNEDFEQLFPKLFPIIKEYPSLVYLDQNGVKFLSDKYLLPLEKTRQTDFLYFVSSSYVKRFGNSKEFQEHLNLNVDEINNNPYKYIHETIVNQLKGRLPTGTKLTLRPFSLKKGTNIHGIVFGASHPLAVDKFLKIAWKKDKLSGQANFDINDSQNPQLDLFAGQKINKIDSFKKRVREKILNREIIDNFMLYDYVLQESHLGAHADECLRQMKKNHEIDYDGVSPLVTYENVYKAKRKITYKIPKQ